MAADALTLNVLILGLVNVAIASATDHYTNGDSSSSSKMTAQQQGAQTTLGRMADNARATADVVVGLDAQLEFVNNYYRSREELY